MKLVPIVGKYLFKVDQLSDVFRARFVEKTRELKNQGIIKGIIPKGLFDKDWVVYAKQPFGGPKQVVKYMGRYTNRTAISNDRILNVDEKQVTFTWKDYANNYKKQVTCLPGEDFLRLFSLHILPHGFTRIRHYGFLSSASKSKSLPIIRTALGVAQVKQSTATKPWQEIAFERMGIKPGICKCCGGKMVIIETMPNLFRQRAPPDRDIEKVLSTCKTEF